MDLTEVAGKERQPTQESNLVGECIDYDALTYIDVTVALELYKELYIHIEY